MEDISLPLFPPPMEPESLLFFWPIFQSAPPHTHTHSPCLWPSPSRAVGTALPRGPLSLRPQLDVSVVTLWETQPQPNGTLAYHFLTHSSSESSFGLRAQRLPEVYRFYLLVSNLGFVGKRSQVRPAFSEAAELGRAPPLRCASV